MIEGWGMRPLAVVHLFMLLQGCGGGTDGPSGSTPTEIGPVGGTITGALGASVFVLAATVGEGSTVGHRQPSARAHRQTAIRQVGWPDSRLSWLPALGHELAGIHDQLAPLLDVVPVHMFGQGDI